MDSVSATVRGRKRTLLADGSTVSTKSGAVESDSVVSIWIFTVQPANFELGQPALCILYRTTCIDCNRHTNRIKRVVNHASHSKFVGRLPVSTEERTLFRKSKTGVARLSKGCNFRRRFENCNFFKTFCPLINLLAHLLPYLLSAHARLPSEMVETPMSDKDPILSEQQERKLYCIQYNFFTWRCPRRRACRLETTLNPLHREACARRLHSAVMIDPFVIPSQS